MSNSIQNDNNKAKKRLKIAKIVGICALVLVLAWTVYSVAVNLNKNERLIANSFIKAFTETKEPAMNTLEDCSAIKESTTSSGKSFKYVVAEIKQGEKKELFIMVVSGKHEGSIYNAGTLSRFDCSDKESIKLEITDHEENVNLQKIQKTLQRYWKFHDVA